MGNKLKLIILILHEWLNINVNTFLPPPTADVVPIDFPGEQTPLLEVVKLSYSSDWNESKSKTNILWWRYDTPPLPLIGLVGEPYCQSSPITVATNQSKQKLATSGRVRQVTSTRSRIWDVAGSASCVRVIFHATPCHFSRAVSPSI